MELNPWAKPTLQTFRRATVAWALPAKYGMSKQEGCNFVIPAQAGIWKFEVAASLKSSQNAEAWIPACAGMTAVGRFQATLPQK